MKPYRVILCVQGLGCMLAAGGAWCAADPDIPIYKQAKAEYAKLG